MSCVGETEVVVYSRVAHGHRPQPTGAERAYWERPLTLREHKSVRPVNSLSPWTIGSSACAGRDEMTATPAKATTV